MPRTDGGYRWVQEQGNPRHHPDGQFAGLIGITIDVHERKTRDVLGELQLRRLYALFTASTTAKPDDVERALEGIKLGLDLTGLDAGLIVDISALPPTPIAVYHPDGVDGALVDLLLPAIQWQELANLHDLFIVPHLMKSAIISRGNAAAPMTLKSGVFAPLGAEGKARAILGLIGVETALGTIGAREVDMLKFLGLGLRGLQARGEATKLKKST